MKAPQTVEGEQKGQVGGFVGITISTGIMIGSLLAFGMAEIIKLSPEYEKNLPPWEWKSSLTNNSLKIQ